MTEQEVLQDLHGEMEKTNAAFRRDLAKLRTGRATSGMLEGIHPEYYGARTPLNQIATVSVPEPRLLIVQPFDRTALAEIDKAIRASDLGLNPLNDGKILRIPIPELTEERRRDIVRHTKKLAEEYRVSLRAHRHDSLELVKEAIKERELTDDDGHRIKEKVETETKAALAHLEDALSKKEKEILTV